MQYFKGDQTELKMDACGAEIMDVIGMQLDLFFEGCYSAYPLGDALFETARSPLANAIDQDIFRQSFVEIFTAFASAGTFESYILVFKKIFGDSVGVEFTVPNPGHLQILIEAEGIELSDFISREIDDNEFIYNEIITQTGAFNIAFQTIIGFKSQYELEQMLFEMVPAGVYTEITLDFLGS